MTHTALIIPTEAPPAATDIKRALITYDKVLIVDPGDREMMPPQSIAEAAVPGSSGFFISNMSGRPLGKLPNYDVAFEQTLDAFRPAIEQGVLQVGSTFTYHPAPRPGQITAGFGSYRPGNYLPNPQVVLAVYRSLCRDQEVLKLAIKEDPILQLSAETLAGLAHDGFADAEFLGDGGLPLIEDAIGGAERQRALTMIARGRIGSIVKGAAYCDLGKLVPIFGAHGYCTVLDNLARKLREGLVALDDDQFWSRRARIMDIAHNLLLDTRVLSEMSIEEVLRLRTVAWGNAEAARGALFASLSKLSMELSASADFEGEARKRIVEYQQKVEDLFRERRQLKWRAVAEITAGVSASSVAGSLALLHSPISSLGIVLAFNGWLALKLEQRGAMLETLKLDESRLQHRAELGLHNFYRGLSASTGR
jgi:hypothetical protein